MTFVYGVPRVFAASDDISWYIATSQERSFISHAFRSPVCGHALALSGASGPVVRRRPAQRAGGGWLCRVPLELVLLALGCAVLMNGVPSSAVTSNFDGSIAAVLRTNSAWTCPPRPTPWRTCCAQGLLFPVFGGDVYVCSPRCARARPGRLAGLSENRSLAARAVRAFACGAGRVWRAVSGTLGRMWRAPHRHRPAGPR